MNGSSGDDEWCAADSDCPSPATWCFSTTSWAEDFFPSKAAEKYAVGMRGCACMPEQGWLVAQDGTCTGISSYTAGVAIVLVIMLFIELIIFVHSLSILFMLFRRTDTNRLIPLCLRSLFCTAVGIGVSVLTLNDFLTPVNMVIFRNRFSTGGRFDQRSSRYEGYTVTIIPLYTVTLVSCSCTVVRNWVTITNALFIKRTNFASKIEKHASRAKAYTKVTYALEGLALCATFFSFLGFGSQTGFLATLPFLGFVFLFMLAARKYLIETFADLKSMDPGQELVAHMEELERLVRKVSFRASLVIMGLGSAVIICILLLLQDTYGREYAKPGTLTPYIQGMLMKTGAWSATWIIYDYIDWLSAQTFNKSNLDSRRAIVPLSNEGEVVSMSSWKKKSRPTRRFMSLFLNPEAIQFKVAVAAQPVDQTTDTSILANIKPPS